MERTTLVDLVELARKPEHGRKSDLSYTRKTPRFDIDAMPAECSYTQPGGNRSDTIAYIVDVSQRGARLIVNNYLHVGTEVRFAFDTQGSERVDLDGTVVWSSYLHGRHHVIGVATDEEIPVRAIVSHEQWVRVSAAHPELELPIHGRAAALTDPTLGLAAIRHQLSGTDVSLRGVTGSGQLLDLVEQGQVDIIILDADIEDVDSVQLLIACRKAKFMGPLVVISIDAESEHLLQFDDSGRSRFLRKPVPPDTITATLRDIMRDHPDCIVHTEAIYSTLARNDETERLLEAFIHECEKHMRTLDTYMQQGKKDSVNGVLRTIMGWGGAYGYQELSDAAQECLRIANDPTLEKRLTSALTTLQHTIGRLNTNPAP